MVYFFSSGRLHLIAALHSSFDWTGHWSFADATPRLWSVSGLQETSLAPPDHSRLQTRPVGHTGPALSQQSGVPLQACRPVVQPRSRPQASVTPHTLVSLQVFRRPALCCSLWLSVNTATSANLPWFIFTGFNDKTNFPEEQPHSSFPKGSALYRLSCPQSPVTGPGRPLGLGPRAPLKGQATNPGRYFRSSFQSHSTPTLTPFGHRPP